MRLDLVVVLGRHRYFDRLAPQFGLPRVDRLAARTEQTPAQFGQLVAQALHLRVELRPQPVELRGHLQHHLLERFNGVGQGRAIDDGRAIHDVHLARGRRLRAVGQTPIA